MKVPAEVRDGIIWVYAVGKWRPIRHYTPRRSVPSTKIQGEVIHSIWLNSGKPCPIEDIELDWKVS